MSLRVCVLKSKASSSIIEMIWSIQCSMVNVVPGTVNRDINKKRSNVKANKKSVLRQLDEYELHILRIGQ